MLNRYKLTVLRRLPFSPTPPSPYLSSPRMSCLNRDLSGLSYPPVDRGDHHDTYASKKEGMVKVADPYRWLEGKGADVESFVESTSATIVISRLELMLRFFVRARRTYFGFHK